VLKAEAFTAGGSTEAFSVERHTLWKKQLLQTLSLIERRVNPQL
jgi:hypothetical protein